MLGRTSDLLNWLPRRYGRVVASASYVPQIDGLRFIAILQVMLYHAALRGQRAYFPGQSMREGVAGWLPNGVAGVELFFFLSGYMICRPFLTGDGPPLKEFFMRRLLRIEPPFVLALIICFILLAVSGYRPSEAVSFNKSDIPLWQSFLASILYSHGMVFHAPPKLNPPLWSLELEVQFYLVAPFLMMVYRLTRNRAVRIRLGLLCVALGIGVQASSSLLPNVLNFTILTHFYAFVLGVIFCDMAAVRHPTKQPGRSLYDLGFLAGLALLLCSGALFYPAQSSSWEQALVLILRMTGIILLYLGGCRGPKSSKLLSLPWITLLGGACYSLYLVHVPVMQFFSLFVFSSLEVHSLPVAWVIGITLTIPPAIAVGVIFYLLVERPCMRRDWPQREASRCRATISKFAKTYGIAISAETRR